MFSHLSIFTDQYLLKLYQKNFNLMKNSNRKTSLYYCREFVNSIILKKMGSKINDPILQQTTTTNNKQQQTIIITNTVVDQNSNIIFDNNDYNDNNFNNDNNDNNDIIDQQQSSPLMYQFSPPPTPVITPQPLNPPSQYIPPPINPFSKDLPLKKRSKPLEPLPVNYKHWKKLFMYGERGRTLMSVTFDLLEDYIESLGWSETIQSSRWSGIYEKFQVSL
ncbi:hypothetical protein ACTFIU_003106 [Dictyostelium citrinum]